MNKYEEINSHDGKGSILDFLKLTLNQSLSIACYGFDKQISQKAKKLPHISHQISHHPKGNVLHLLSYKIAVENTEAVEHSLGL